jgi:hypothetical protein
MIYFMKLVYLTLFNRTEINLFKVLMLSIKEDVEFLVFTPYEREVMQVGSVLGVTIRTQNVEEAFAKCRIFETEVEKYTHFIYLELGHVVTGALEVPPKDVLYVNDHAWAFPNTPTMRKKMTDFYTFVSLWNQYKEPSLETPFIPLFFETRELSLNATYFSDYGNAASFFTTLVPDKKSVCLFHKVYHWNFGYVMFKDGLETTWGEGSYHKLGDRTYHVNFGGFDHYVTFDETFENLMSFRYHDGDIVHASEIFFNY